MPSASVEYFPPIVCKVTTNDETWFAWTTILYKWVVQLNTKVFSVGPRVRPLLDLLLNSSSVDVHKKTAESLYT